MASRQSRGERILQASINAMAAGKRQPHCGEAAKGSIDDLDVQWAAEYAEPGHDQPDKGIIFANWNQFSRDLDRTLERAGYAIEWSDEWDRCADCNRAVRTSANSYHWQPSFVLMGDCDVVCKDCLDVDEYITEQLLNNPNKADQLGIDLTLHGFERHNRDHYEAGLHPGQNDNPREIAKGLPKGFDYVFQIPTVQQFDIRFDVWLRPVDVDTTEDTTESEGN
jgi:hypothetical protein